MNNFINRIEVVINHLKDGDFDYLIKSIKKGMASKDVSLGLKRDLCIPFKGPNSKINIYIRLFEESDSKYFYTEYVNGIDLLKTPKCYVAVDDNDVPCFRQWLIVSKENKKIQSYFGDLFPYLKEGEALFEGGFVFPKIRGNGIMSAGLSKIAEKAKQDGVENIITFVNIHNTPSLKGCEHAGFAPYILRTEKWFLFKRKVMFTPIPDSLMLQYLKNVAGKSKSTVKKLHLV